MTTPTKSAMWALIRDLRGLAPVRPLSYGQSLHFARMQADYLRRRMEPSRLAINLLWLRKQRAVPVNFVASHLLHEESGATTDHITGRLEVFINDSDSRLRQRFSILHELKHVLDWDNADVLHAQLGSGIEDIQKNQVEAIANDFAAHVLMPAAMVKSTWFKCQDLPLVASLFDVSIEAMARRLNDLGLTGEPKPMPRVYFQRSSGLSVCRTMRTSLASLLS